MVTNLRIRKGLAAYVAALLPALAGGFDVPVAQAAEAGFSVDGDSATSSSEPGSSDESAFLLAGKVGGIVPLNGLNPFVRGGIELGWIFGGTEQRMAALLDFTYTAPAGDGSASDPRLSSGAADGSYSYELVQKELVLAPTFLYRLTGSGSLVPFVGIGPRVYFLETVAEGQANGEAIPISHERSTKLGAGIPLGVEYGVGPGGLFAELLAEWAPLDHRITGDTSLFGLTLFLGYRARL